MDITTEVRDAFSLGQIIQQSRLQQDMSQRDLAAALGISQKWVWEMEQGKPGILMDRLFKVLDATGITLYAKFEVTRNYDDMPNNESADKSASTKKATLRELEQ